MKMSNLLHASETCAHRNHGLTSSKEGINTFLQAGAVMKTFRSFVLGSTIEDSIKEAYEAYPFDNPFEEETIKSRTEALVKRYASLMDEMEIIPNLVEEERTLRWEDGTVLEGVKPTYTYLKEVEYTDKLTRREKLEGKKAPVVRTLHVVKVKNAKKPAKATEKMAPVLYSLLSYGRSMIAPNLAEKTRIIAEIHYLGSEGDKTTAIYNEAKEKIGEELVFASKLIEKEQVVRTFAEFDSVEGWSQTMIDEIAEDICLEMEKLPLDEKYLVNAECSEEDCKNCENAAICNYKKAPLQVKLEKIRKSMSELSLTEKQEQAVLFENGYLRIAAKAGSGKTTVVACRVASMIAQGVDPKSFLCITFTNSGATEMKERILGYCEDNGIEIEEDDLMVMTFNALGETLLENFYEDLGYTAVPTLIDEVSKYEIINQILSSCGKKISGLDYRFYSPSRDNSFRMSVLEIVKFAFDTIKANKLVDGLDGYRELPRLMGSKAFCLGKQSTMNFGGISMVCYESVPMLFELYAEYVYIFEENNYCDYADQEDAITNLFATNPYIWEELGVSHIIVDEFQDTSLKEMEIVKTMTSNKEFKSLMVVGDDSQAIYGFRNCTPENFIKFFDLLGVEEEDRIDLRLLENHRSVPEILNLADVFVDQNSFKLGSKAVATRPANGELPRIMGFWDKDEELEYIINGIKEEIATGRNLSEIAVLMPDNAKCSEIGGLLAGEGIPTIMMNPEVLLDNSRVIAAIALCKYLKDEKATLEQAKYANALLGGKFAEMSELEQNVYLEDMTVRESILKKKGPKALEAFKDALEAISEEDEVYINFVERILRKGSVEECIKYALLFEKYGFKEAVRREAKYEGVVITTSHSSKGLEWPVVFCSISGMGSKCRNHVDVEEKRRLIYVSMTRAKDILHITSLYAAGRVGRKSFEQFLYELYNLSGKSEEFPTKPEETKAEKEKRLAAKKAAEESKSAVSETEAAAS